MGSGSDPDLATETCGTTLIAPAICRLCNVSCVCRWTAACFLRSKPLTIASDRPRFFNSNPTAGRENCGWAANRTWKKVDKQRRKSDLSQEKFVTIGLPKLVKLDWIDWIDRCPLSLTRLYWCRWQHNPITTLWFKKTRQLWRTITTTQFSRF